MSDHNLVWNFRQISKRADSDSKYYYCGQYLVDVQDFYNEKELLGVNSYYDDPDNKYYCGLCLSGSIYYSKYANRWVLTGWEELEYNIYGGSVKLGDAAKMVKTLTKINKAMQKIEDNYGKARTLGDVAQRLLIATKMKAVWNSKWGIRYTNLFNSNINDAIRQFIFEIVKEETDAETARQELKIVEGV